MRASLRAERPTIMHTRRQCIIYSALYTESRCSTCKLQQCIIYRIQMQCSNLDARQHSHTLNPHALSGKSTSTTQHATFQTYSSPNHAQQPKTTQQPKVEEKINKKSNVEKRLTQPHQPPNVKGKSSAHFHTALQLSPDATTAITPYSQVPLSKHTCWKLHEPALD